MPLADRALVVGINRYPGISILQGAENDAQDFYEWVIDKDGGGVDTANARLITSSGNNLISNARPVKEEVEQFFIEIDAIAVDNNNQNLGLKAGRRLWLFFSGHGFAPSLDQSAVLMANATSRIRLNIAAKMWADRLCEGGWFDEVLLFQDACRQAITNADLQPPFLLKQTGGQQRRFYAFSAKNRKLSKEIPVVGGKVRGVFAFTLMEGLRGGAVDANTGSVTTAQLKAYLQDNMQRLLSAADLQNDDIAKEPEVFDPDPFVIVPAKDGRAAVAFPVKLIVANPPAHIEDAGFEIVKQQEPATNGAWGGNWEFCLPRGMYKAVAQGGGQALFEVTGAILPDGSQAVTSVNL
jgi:hypothetical protein